MGQEQQEPNKGDLQPIVPQKPENSVISGTVHKIVFQAEDTGFTVARVKVKGEKDPITVVGSIAGLKVGENVEFSGKWGDHKKFGRQFQVESYMPLQPGTLVGLEKYLGSGLIKGIGPAYARKIVKKFGLDTLDIIENQPDRIREVEGVGVKRANMIISGWNAHKNIRNIMIFLQGYGVGPARAFRIHKAYGDRAMELVRENPYRLSEEIWGIGFKIADSIAQNMGFNIESPHRAKAAILFALTEAADEGHCFLPKDELEKKCVESLGVPKDVFSLALDEMTLSGRLIFEDPAIYLKQYYFSEKKSAQALVEIMNAPFGKPPIDVETALNWVQKRIDIELSKSQAQALKLVLSSKISIITGGPGVGKTTILRALCMILKRSGWIVSLCAPTGRAAKRMTEAIGIDSKTIHRLLKYKPSENKFEHDGSNQLNTDCVIVDEMSMVDITLLYNLLAAIPLKAKLVMVGDVDQLPSVGAGMVLKDMIESGVIPTARLTEIHRQKQGSLIISNAHRINRGEFPFIPKRDSDELSDFYFVPTEDPDKIQEIIIKTVTERIAQRFNFHPIRDVQVISPMAKRVLGAKVLNDILQEAQNKNPVQLSVFGKNFKLGDKVMQIRNNYEHEVFNGDIGTIVNIDSDRQYLSVEYDGSIVDYHLDRLDEIVLAYACTVHKSQGSEFPAVVMPLYTGHYVLLQRNLLYTAITRAKQLVVLVGSRKALGMAISNNKIDQRNTGLKRRIQEVEK